MNKKFQKFPRRVLGNFPKSFSDVCVCLCVCVCGGFACFAPPKPHCFSKKTDSAFCRDFAKMPASSSPSSSTEDSNESRVRDRERRFAGGSAGSEYSGQRDNPNKQRGRPRKVEIDIIEKPEVFCTFLDILLWLFVDILWTFFCRHFATLSCILQCHFLSKPLRSTDRHHTLGQCTTP